MSGQKGYISVGQNVPFVTGRVTGKRPMSVTRFRPLSVMMWACRCGSVRLYCHPVVWS
ncbi:hypothetical protein PL145_01865 [Dickeya fangzhongdai]|nr:hypothetical protein [Dickeya fangzhongdai]WKV52823.1 hypothetical protein PL145_01865 [Dickeya fangzhongdai]